MQHDDILEKLHKEKEKLCLERDMCAEMCNMWITRLHDFQENEDKYKVYANLLMSTEKYTNTLKEEVREINRKICEILKVNDINETDYVHTCKYKFGMDRPNNLD